MNTAIIFTSRMDELAAFYQRGLDIGPFERSPKHIGCRVGALYLGFDQIEESSASPERTTGPTLWFAVDDIHATFDRLIALGASVRYPPTQKPHAGFVASLKDLDGNIFGITQQIESR